MPTYLFSYRSPRQRTPMSPDGMAAWGSFFEDLGERLVDGGNPVFESTPVGECGPETVLGGYTMVSADDLESAAAMAQGCPLLAQGGGVEVGEITPVTADSLTASAGDHTPATGLAG